MTNYRNEKGYLVAGHPGLPGAGRPSVDPETRAETQRILTAATPHAAKRLVEMLDAPDLKIRLQATEAVLSRIFGKPVAQMEAKVETTTVQQAHLQILLELQAEAQAREKNSGARQHPTADTLDVTSANNLVTAIVAQTQK